MAAGLTDAQRLDRLYQEIDGNTADLDTFETLIGDPPTLDITEIAPRYGKSPWLLLIERERGRYMSILDAVLHIYDNKPGLYKKMNRIWTQWLKNPVIAPAAAPAYNNAAAAAMGAPGLKPAMNAAAISALMNAMGRGNQNTAKRILETYEMRNLNFPLLPSPPPPPPPPPPTPKEELMTAIQTQKYDRVLELYNAFTPEEQSEIFTAKLIKDGFLARNDLAAMPLRDSVYDLFMRLIERFPERVEEAVTIPGYPGEFDSRLYDSLTSANELLSLMFQRMSFTFLQGSSDDITVFSLFYKYLTDPQYYPLPLTDLLQRGYNPFELEKNIFRYCFLIRTETSFRYAVQMIIEAKQFINTKGGPGSGPGITYTPFLSVFAQSGIPPHIRKTLIQVLLDNGADVNQIVTAGGGPGGGYHFTPLHMFLWAANKHRADYPGTLEDGDLSEMFLLLISHPTFNVETNLAALERNQTLDPTPNPFLKAAIQYFRKQLRDKTPFEGYTREDILEYSGLLRNPINYSICPICLSSVVRTEACMYMRHDCSAVTPLYDEELFNKYKDHEGKITWCSYCSRVCDSYPVPGGLGHRHWPAVLATDPKPRDYAPIAQGAAYDPFAPACVNQGGGGVLEKFLKIRRLREVAKELQDEAGTMSAYDAKVIAIREMWNAFAARKPQAKKIMDKAAEVMAEILPAAQARRPSANAPVEFTDPELERLNSIWGSYNLPTANFPLAGAEQARRAAEAAERANANLTERARANLARPNTGPEFQPVRHEGITCCICMDDDRQPTWQFRHRNRAGELYNHPLEDTGICNGGVICEVDLANHIANMLRAKGTADFGRCWNEQQCGGLLWPQEVRGKIPEELYEQYRVEFNKAYLSGRLRGGGGNRRQRGGKIPFLTPISPNSVETSGCMIVKKSKGGTRRRLRKNRKTQRHRRQQRK